MGHRTAIWWSTVAVLTALLVGTSCSGPTTPEPEPAPVAAILSIDSVATLGGRNIDVPVRLSYPADPSELLDSLGGFELLVQYDSGLTLVEAIKGDAVSSWEYWAWRTSAFGGGPAAEPYGVRIVSIRDMQNGAEPDPPQFYPEGSIATLRFFVTFDQQFYNTCPGIRFALLGCNDNVLSTGYRRATLWMPDTTVGEARIGEGYTQSGCSPSDSVPARLELRSGQVCILEPPPAPGDINGDGIPYSIGDVNPFIDLFQGRTTIDSASLPEMLIRTDCNGDGRPLTIADFDYFFRVVLGEADRSDPLPPPYGDSVSLDLIADGTDWLIEGSSTAGVSGLDIRIMDVNGTTLGAEWLGDTYDVSLSGIAMGDTLRIIVISALYNFPKDVMPEGNWPMTIRIIGDAESHPVIVGAEASMAPGVLMKVVTSP